MVSNRISCRRNTFRFVCSWLSLTDTIKSFKLLYPTLVSYMNFKGKDIVSIRDFSKEEIGFILELAERMRPIADGKEHHALSSEKIMAALFFEPSTRTRLSFESAMNRLGGRVISFAEPGSTSIMKGETLADTIKMAEAYSDVIVLRHNKEGASRLASDFSAKPVINAGDGAGQHPTQTLLDLFTIKAEKKKIEKNHIVMVGDLKYGRTVHSLAYALAKYNVEITFVAPPQLQIQSEIIDYLRQHNIKPNQTKSLKKAVSIADVLYVTRIQKERFPEPEEYKKVSEIYRVDNELLTDAKSKLIVMHPLPRVNEIAPEVDLTHHALYFKQAANGVLVRMALLALVLLDMSEIKEFMKKNGGGQ